MLTKSTSPFYGIIPGNAAIPLGSVVLPINPQLPWRLKSCRFSRDYTDAIPLDSSRSPSSSFLAWVHREWSCQFSRRNPLLSSANRSSVLAFDFFHYLLGFGHGGETGNVDPPADPAASSRDLFLPPTVFMLLDVEGFILQVHRVFTHIRSGATAVATSGDALGFTISTEAAVCTDGGSFA
jgi:hypothetical protein